MKNFEYYYDGIYKEACLSDALEFAEKRGMRAYNCTTNFQDLLIWLNEERPILDEEEKKYINAVIKPFRNEVEFIIKRVCLSSNEYFLSVEFENYDSMTFPNFKQESGMYKGMKLNVNYTLEELGL